MNSANYIPYVKLSYSITPVGWLRTSLILRANKLGNPLINFSFQNDLVQSSLKITLEVNTSLYHLKSLKVGQVRLPIKCRTIV